MKIADQLTHDTWCRGFSPDDHRRCILGWIDFCYPHEKRRDIEGRLLEHIYGFKRKNVKRKLGQCLSVWNDSMTYAEVRKVVVELNV